MTKDAKRTNTLSSTQKKNAATETSADLESASRVLSLEAQGIHALADSLDDKFIRALVKLYIVTGRVIVTGMG